MADTGQTGKAFLDIVNARRSMRDFKTDPVPEEVIAAVFGAAQRAPSNCNTQPWFVHVVTGETLERLRAELPAKFAAGEIALSTFLPRKSEDSHTGPTTFHLFKFF